MSAPKATRGGWTPGPWRVDGIRVWSEAAKDRGSVAACGALRLGLGCDGEARANADLIAAAPDLVAALEACERYIADPYRAEDEALDATGGNVTAEEVVLDLARAALAKARGES